MALSRRHFLAASAAFGASLTARADLLPASTGRRVVIVGGGWGGLAAARTLREQAPDLEVVVVEKEVAFWSNPLSNLWLVGLNDGTQLTRDLGAAARTFGYRLITAEVTAIDRERRRVVTAAGALAYDWLILAVGIRHDYGAWFGDDRAAAEYCRKHFPAAFTGPGEALALKRRIAAFTGGDWLLTVPPMPYRCPPAPYERAGLLAWSLEKRGLPGHIHVLDPNPAALGFDRIFKSAYRERINYLPQARIVSLDPFKKVVTTDFDTIAFAEAILLPPQQAGDLVWQADLMARDAAGKATGWAAMDPIQLHAPGDERVYLVGDIVDKASLLFGHYPKTGHMAARLGRIAAQAIAARSQGREPEKRLPESTCYVAARAEPRELMRVDTHYRLRGDGVIQQTVKQSYDAQPEGEDEAWQRAQVGELFGTPAL
ncbi:MAG: NAD(P)/FAD-dependent oxidoreductase [Azonexus sp.]|nr:NAD(P)/FAD-dependent oxidoreductase [Betaproteobacteria bacterium]MBK8919021.1 NAD(P)/FAD-dependent oxidoreductase [Betaproteobacteria bacterium]MBP6036690.1 NAD(P)/FAD-dependent oxidoreductase [Azonexus sp.]MBP6905473.1 NAD(P)/FAD-dependent oxidoreductase [Azonexus sp.]